MLLTTINGIGVFVKRCAVISAIYGECHSLFTDNVREKKAPLSHQLDDCTTPSSTNATIL